MTTASQAVSLFHHYDLLLGGLVGPAIGHDETHGSRPTRLGRVEQPTAPVPRAEPAGPINPVLVGNRPGWLGLRLIGLAASRRLIGCVDHAREGAQAVTPHELAAAPESPRVGGPEGTRLPVASIGGLDQLAGRATRPCLARRGATLLRIGQRQLLSHAPSPLTDVVAGRRRTLRVVGRRRTIEAHAPEARPPHIAQGGQQGERCILRVRPHQHDQVQVRVPAMGLAMRDLGRGDGAGQGGTEGPPLAALAQALSGLLEAVEKLGKRIAAPVARRQGHQDRHHAAFRPRPGKEPVQLPSPHFGDPSRARRAGPDAAAPLET